MNAKGMVLGDLLAAVRADTTDETPAAWVEIGRRFADLQKSELHWRTESSYADAKIAGLESQIDQLLGDMEAIIDLLPDAQHPRFHDAPAAAHRLSLAQMLAYSHIEPSEVSPEAVAEARAGA